MNKLLMAIFAVASMNAVIARADEIKKIAVEVNESGFSPKTIDVKPGADVTLEVIRKTDQTCSKEIQVPSQGIKKTALPLNKSVAIHPGKLKKGEIRFGCGMDMMDSGKIIVR